MSKKASNLPPTTESVNPSYKIEYDGKYYSAWYKAKVLWFTVWQRLCTKSGYNCFYSEGEARTIIEEHKRKHNPDIKKVWYL